MKKVLVYGLSVLLAVMVLSCNGFNNSTAKHNPDVTITPTVVPVGIPVGVLDGYAYVDADASPIQGESAASSPIVVDGRVPIAGATVRISGTNLSAITDANGRFTINGVPPGVHKIIIEYLDSGGTYEYATIIAGINQPHDQGLHLGWLKLNKSGEIAGTVTLYGLTTGNEGITVFIPGTKYQTTTDDAGNFLITKVPEGVYEVAAAKNEYCPQVVENVSVTKNTTTSGVDMSLSFCTDTGSVTGFAYLAGQTDHRNILVEDLNSGQSTTTNVDGLWTAAVVPAGVYNLSFSKNGYNPVTLNNILVLGGGVTTVETVYLIYSGSLDSDGDGILDIDDPDDDNDGTPDLTDAFPLDPTEWLDTDSDGIGNNADMDDDNDQFPDLVEIAEGTDPLDSTSFPIWECNDGIDNDGDTYIDYPDDKSCISIMDTSEIKTRMLALGALHTCAITDTGGVKCWGWELLGRLGIGSGIAITPKDVVGLQSGVVSIDAGGAFTCALTDVGGVKCWGNNDSGELGNNQANGDICSASNIDYECSLTPVDVCADATCSAPLMGVKQIALSETHSCALMNDGGVKCWGRNYWGCLGDGTTEDRLTPVDVIGLPSGVAAIAAGGDKTCALMDDGSVKCWGRVYIPTQPVYVPTDVPLLYNGAVAISMGYEHMCALMNTGGVKCWGDNYYGQLGNGTRIDSEDPVDVLGLPNGVVSLNSLYYRSCAITPNGEVKCWGDNTYATLRVDTDDSCLTKYSHAYCTTALDIPGFDSPSVEVGIGMRDGCAVSNKGIIKCWGWNSYGEVGDGTTVQRYLPVKVKWY